jgi:hypothetical protein
LCAQHKHSYFCTCGEKWNHTYHDNQGKKKKSPYRKQGAYDEIAERRHGNRDHTNEDGEHHRCIFLVVGSTPPSSPEDNKALFAIRRAATSSPPPSFT